MKNRKQDFLYHSKRELAIARSAIDKMKEATVLEILEEKWMTYLNSIEKYWVKAEIECSDLYSNFKPWQGIFVRQRKKDPLLKYLKHARNSDQHTIQESMDKKPASSSMYIEGNSAYIEKLVIKDGKLVEYKGSKPLIIENLPNRIELLPVKDRGKIYYPPKKHLDKKISWPAPVDVAELGLEYYLTFLEKVEKKFSNLN